MLLEALGSATVFAYYSPVTSFLGSGFLKFRTFPLVRSAGPLFIYIYARRAP